MAMFVCKEVNRQNERELQLLKNTCGRSHAGRFDYHVINQASSDEKVRQNDKKENCGFLWLVCL